MSPIKACVALITLLAASTFANGQEVADEAPVATPAAEEAPAAATPVAEETPAPASSAEVAVAAADADAPVKVVDAAALIARDPPPIVCREMLKRNSNVHILQCLTAEQWKIYQRAEAADAARIVRMMQGNPYR